MSGERVIEYKNIERNGRVITHVPFEKTLYPNGNGESVEGHTIISGRNARITEWLLTAYMPNERLKEFSFQDVTDEMIALCWEDM